MSAHAHRSYKIVILAQEELNSAVKCWLLCTVFTILYLVLERSCFQATSVLPMEDASRFAN